jgi:hypothetical protein
MRPHLLLLLGLASCGYEDGLPGPPAGGEWIAIEPGGETICSDGSPYRFFVRGGDPERVIIDFRGGGACWDGNTCTAADVLYASQAGELQPFLDLLEAGELGGIFDGEGSRYFADWTIVHIPYCTGDIHWGNAEQQYLFDLHIHHKGFVNASAVLDWVYARYASPDTIFVSGCSAGAYGAALHSAYIADHYEDANVAVLADSGAGIISEDFLTTSFPNWGAEANLPPFIPSLQVPITELSLPDLYIAVGEHFPDMRLAQTAAHYDQDQIFYFTAMGGTAADWPAMFRASLETISTALPENFRYYVPAGPVHCATPYPIYFEREVDGVALDAWVEDLIDGPSPPASVGCEGAECCDDPICAACAANGNADRWCSFCRGWPDDWPECAAP